MKILIIEDEKPSAARLIRQLRQIAPDSIIDGPVTSVSECRDHLNNNAAPDLIISDIRLTDGLSFEVLTDITDFIPIIFLTAYDKYAIEAFEYNGISYLMKPVSLERLAESINRVKKMRSAITTDGLSYMSNRPNHMSHRWRERFLVSQGDSLSSISSDDISLISANDGNSMIHCSNSKSYFYKAPLDKLETELNPDCFFRTSRAHIVNINHISRIHVLSTRKLGISIEGHPEISVTVSKERLSAFKQWLGDM